jgi:hypothetical protein
MFGELLCLNCRGITEKRASMGKLRIEEMAHAHIGMLVAASLSGER